MQHYNKKQAAVILSYCERTFYRYLAQTNITVKKGLFLEEGLKEIEVAFKKLEDEKIKKKLPPK